MNILDAANRVQHTAKGGHAEISGLRDWVWTNFPRGGRYLYATEGSNLLQLDLLQGTTLRTQAINLGQVETSEGITFDGRYWIITVHLNDGETADRFYWIDVDGSIIRNVSNDQGLVSAYTVLTFFQNRLYIVDETNNNCDVYDGQGKRVNSFSITAGDQKGITHDRKNLWIITDNTIRQLDIAGNVLQSFTNPDEGLANYSAGLTFNHRFLIVEQSLALIGDLVP